MARGSTLIQVRAMVKGETGDSLVAGVNAQTDAIINRRIVQNQQWLSNEFKWPFLFGSFDVGVAAGQRFVTFPSINLDNSVKVSVKFNHSWNQVDYGIGPSEYNVYDSERGLGSNSITRWREWRGTPPTAQNTLQVEVWPIPSIPQTLRMEGQCTLQARPTMLVHTSADDALILDLDDLMLALYTAAQMQNSTPLGQLLNSKAQARFNQLRAHSSSESNVFALGARQIVGRRETVVTINKSI